MTRFISSRKPISATSLKRRPLGTVVFHHIGNWEDHRFTRVYGGWLKERTDYPGIDQAVVVSSTVVAAECNKAVGCKDSWAEIY